MEANVDKGIDQRIARLSGYDRPSEEKAIRDLIANSDDNLIARLESELAKSQWPLCTSLAKALAEIGGSNATAALINCIKSRNKHVRTASINALVAIGDPALAALLEPLLSDPAFTTRIAARDGIEKLTGKVVKTARDE